MAFASCSYVAATYQPKLKDCNGADLPAGTEMATCADLAGLSIADATDTTKGKVALNAGTSLPGDATNCTDALTACGLNALLADATVGGNAVINGVKALIPLATTTVAGLIEEATGEETRLGATDANRADRAVTPESMSYALQTAKNYSINVSKTGTDATGSFDSMIKATSSTGGSRIGVMGELADVGGSIRNLAVFGFLSGGTVNSAEASGASGGVASAVTTPTGMKSYGVYGTNSSAGSGNKYGVYGLATAGGGTNIAVYGYATNGATNWAGYFDGNTNTTGSAAIAVGANPGLSDWSGFSVLEVARKGNAFWSAAVDDFRMSANMYYNGGYKYAAAGRASRYEQSSGTHSWFNAPSGAAGAAVTFTQHMTLLENGFLGVGTLSPTSTIHAGGTVTAAAYITSSDETLKENVEAIDAAKALQFRNGLQWKKYELFSEQQVEIMEEVTEEVQKTDAEGNPVVDADGNPVMETLTKQVGTGRYEVKRNSQGIKRGLIAQEVQALAASIGDFSDVVVEVGEYFTLDAQGYPVKDAQGNNIVNKRLGLDYDAIQFVICAGEQSLLPAVV